MDASQENPLLQVENLRVSFATDTGMRECVHGISFSLRAGEVLGLVGESGSGKSITSLAILRLLEPTAQVSGAIRFAGANLLELREAAMRRHRGSSIAMIFQEPMTALNPVMPIGEQIAESVRAHHPRLGSREIRDRVVEAMQQVALPNAAARYNDYPHQFSGGQRQRILIAMAIVNCPQLLIADEPTTALDVTVQAQILDLLAELRERHKLAMLFISHDLAVVSRTAHHIAVMRHGEIIETGTRSDVFGHPQHWYTRNLLAAIPTMRTDRSHPLAQIAAASPA